jgi:O-antigen biosynthesis protein
MSATSLSEPARGAASAGSAPLAERARAEGKFLFVGDKKLYVKGVTYGTFRPDENGLQFPPREIVEQDFAAMREAGFNCVRTYTPPPLWLLDLAAARGLRVMAGLPWEQHIAFLKDRRRADDIVRRIAGHVRELAGHPGILCFTVGNEIPATVVRWHGKRRMERFLERLYRAVKREDPEALTAYVNFPTTEYLELPFVDLFCFNVYLEEPDRLDAYLARLQNLAGDRPLLMAEIGLDSLRNGVERQAAVLGWQIPAVFRAGCAGCFVFAWTDEWYRGGFDVEDWDFGLLDRDRRPKPALASAREAFSTTPFPVTRRRPKVSIVVCTYNGRKTLSETIEGLDRLEYPNYEVILVSDGSSDGSVALAHGRGMRVIAGRNRGLSAARNIGLHAATGEILVYIDDDAWPDPHWLHYIADAFESTDFVALGGPNLSPLNDPLTPQCVANAPGNASHVLLTDRQAEHIPGCNFAVRRDALLRIGGFDATFRIAGDDVDCCWRLEQDGGKIGFHPGAMIWHHRRSTVRAYLNQQRNYGRAEAILERKWPERYNAIGHLRWEGRIYGGGLSSALRGRPRIYHGVWGSAAFQGLYADPVSFVGALPLIPEWYLINLALALLGALGVLWTPLFGAWALLAVTAGAPALQALRAAREATFPPTLRGRWILLRARALTAFLHLAQPAARLHGRLKEGLTPWRVSARAGFAFPLPREIAVWSEQWRMPEDRLEQIRQMLSERGVRVAVGGPYDSWDLETVAGLLGSARLVQMVEEHGSGKQLSRFLVRPRMSAVARALPAAFALLAAGAAAADAALAAGVLAIAAGALGLPALVQCGFATGALTGAVKRLEAEELDLIRQKACDDAEPRREDA